MWTFLLIALAALIGGFVGYNTRKREDAGVVFLVTYWRDAYEKLRLQTTGEGS